MQRSRTPTMTQQAFERGDWQAVIDAHPLESHDPAEWLRYGVALLQTLTPGAEAGKQQQQAALAFLQAQKEGASAEAVAAAQRQAVLLGLSQSLQLAGMEASGERTQSCADHQGWISSIYLRIAKHQWLEASEKLSTLTASANEKKQIKSLLKSSIFGAISGTTQDRSPGDYASINQLREQSQMMSIDDCRAALEATVCVDMTTPLVLINNYTLANKNLENYQFWIAYGNVRTGSTMVFNLLRILANSLSSSAISAWEGDLVSPEKFFELVNESNGVNLGVLKIHRNNESVNTRLKAGQAKAIVSHRDMKTACYSYWRMLNNPRSPFFKNSPEKGLLKKFIEEEIKEFELKSQQCNTLIVRERDLRSDTEETISTIVAFLGIELARESLQHLSSFLEVNNLRRITEANATKINSTGHEMVTYLHPGHIAKSTSAQECPQEIKDYVSELVQKYSENLDQEGYCRANSTLQAFKSELD